MTENQANSPAEITTMKVEHLKGLAVILLMWHHLFGVGYITDWTEIIPDSKGVVFIICSASKICLAIFLFCSGYGLFKTYISKDMPKKNYIFQRLIKILIPYWLVMVLTIAYLVFAGKFEPKYVFVNLFALIHNDSILYVSFSWFIKLYLLLILMLPLIRLIERKWKKNALIDILIYVAAPFVIAVIFGKHINGTEFTGILSFILGTILFVLAWFPLFAVGMLFAKYDTYKTVRKKADRLPSLLSTVLLITIIACIFFLRYMTDLLFRETVLYPNCMLDVIYGPVVICSLLIIMDNIKRKSKYVIPYIGKNSVYYWLLSSFFFLNTKELIFLITWPKITIPIFIWTMILLTPFVFACSFVSEKLVKLISRKL